jgi:hypothetical protein
MGEPRRYDKPYWRASNCLKKTTGMDTEVPKTQVAEAEKPIE